jgi:hypothetical protein
MMRRNGSGNGINGNSCWQAHQSTPRITRVIMTPMIALIMSALAGSLVVGEVSLRPSYEYHEDHFILRPDIGGDVGHYARHFADIERRGLQVRIEGDCLSACTMVLKNKLTCAMPGARFGFHLAHTYNRETKEIIGLSDYGNKVLWEHYPIHVRQRLGTLTENMVFVRATDFIPPCKPVSAARRIISSFRAQP